MIQTIIITIYKSVGGWETDMALKMQTSSTIKYTQTLQQTLTTRAQLTPAQDANYSGRRVHYSTAPRDVNLSHLPR